jgi:hypothetical protein
VKRARAAAIGVVAAAAVALAIGHHGVWVLLAETRLRLGIGKANPALETILSSGNDAALARLARFVVMERNSERGRYAKRQLESAVAYDLKGGTRPLIPHLLRLAASIDDDSARAAALETIGALVANEDRGAIYVHRDGELYFHAYYATQHRAMGAPSEYPSFFIAERAPRPALFAWADWLVAHGFLEANAPVLAELGPPPPPYDGPPRIGVVAENLVVKVVVPDLPADRAGIHPDDVLRTLDGAPLGELSEIGRALAKKDEVVVGIFRPREEGISMNVTIRR